MMSEKHRKRTPFLKEMFDRRVPQVTGLYLGASWGVMEFVQYIVGHYSLSPHLEEISLVVLLSLIPSVCVVVYYHGKGDWEHWSKLEIFGIPINLVLTCILLFSIFQGKELGAATTKVVVKDERGLDVERVVAKSGFRKSIVLFNLKNDSGDESLNWLGQALPSLIHYDLLQDIFVNASSPLLDQNLDARVKKSGFGQGMGIPIALCRQLAEEFHMSFFLSGSFTGSEENFVVTVTLYETVKGKRLAETTREGNDIFQLVDHLVVQLKEDLDIPKVQIEQVVDLPIGEIFTASFPALKAMTQGFEAAFQDGDLARSQILFERAVEKDPSFAFCWFALSSFNMVKNEPERAKASLGKAEKYSFKFPDLIKFQLKDLRYMLDGEPQKSLNLRKMQVEIYPDHIEARQRLAQQYATLGRSQESLGQYEHILKLAPDPHLHYHTVGDLYLQLGKRELALSFYQKYAERFPKDAASFSKLGNFYEGIGDYANARDYYEKAAMLDAGNIAVQLDLADVTFYSGRFVEALEKYESILAGATGPGEKMRVLNKIASYYRLCGQLGKSVETKQRFFEIEEHVRGAVNVFIKQLLFSGTMVRAGQVEKSLALIQKIEGEMKPPFSDMVPLGYLLHYLALKDVVRTESVFSAVLANEESMRVIGLGNVITLARANFYELKGELTKAIEILERHGKKNPTNSRIFIDLGRCYRQLGHLEKARVVLADTLTRIPYNGEANFEMAMLLVESGKKEKAKEHLKHSLKIWEHADPRFVLAREAREALNKLH